jgi:hypothetical protein
MKLDVPGRTELLEGLIYDLSPINPPHLTAMDYLNDTLVPALLNSNFRARVESPIAIDGWKGNDAPHPDVAIIARRQYDELPTSADAVTLIEVSDTTYKTDREIKIPIYVHAGIPSWIVNIALAQVEYYATVDDLRLRFGRVFSSGECFEIAGVSIAIGGLFRDRTTGTGLPGGD